MEAKLYTFNEKQKQTPAYKFFNSLEYGDQCQNWKNFEKYIIKCFRNAGFKVVPDIKKCKIAAKDDISLKDYVKDLKDRIKDNLTVANTMKYAYKDIVVYQPYGTTASPDFLWITPNYVVPIECKLSHRQSPKWNSLPSEDTLIIFASTKDKIITYFWGYQVLMGKARDELNSIKAKMDRLWKKEYDKTKQLKNSPLKIYFNFSDFTDTSNYSSNELNEVRQNTVLKLFVKEEDN